MKITNRYNLPQPIVDAITMDDYDYSKKGDFSVSELIMPPRIRNLVKRHFNEIEVDVSSRIWLLLGNAIHYILSKADTSNHISEERMTIELLGKKITGKPDLFNNDKLSDYKVTSTWAYIYGKPEWEYQTNLYRYIASKHSFNISKLEIVCIFRDWVRSRTNDPNYPVCPVATVNIPLWDDIKCNNYIMDRLKLHLACETLKDADLPYCEANERWYRGESYACIKKGQKRAKRVFTSDLEASQYSEANGLETVKREGISTRCNPDYCLGAKFCKYYKQVDIKNEED